MSTSTTRPPEIEPGTLTTPEGVSERQAVLDTERAQWLTVKEAAYVLRTNEHTILHAIHLGHLNLFALGKVWRIHVDSLKACQKIRAEWQPPTVSHSAGRRIA